MAEGDVIGAFRQQADACRSLGSPFVARVCALFAERLVPDGAVSRALLGWPPNGAAARAAVPLRMAGALHALVLEKRCTDLQEGFPLLQASDSELWDAISKAMHQHESFILRRLESAPQTNEIRRSAALLPGMLVIASLTGHPLKLSEIGASAGLNLILDQYHYRLGPVSWGDSKSQVLIAPEWEGEAPPAVDMRVADRRGCDLTPLNLADSSDRLRLLSYIWADQTERMDRARAALDIAGRNSVQVDPADVADWLPQRFAETGDGLTHVIYHSIMWQYMPRETQRAVESMIRAHGARASASAPLAWLRLEPDSESPPGASLRLTLWPSGEELTLARADFHGRWVRWFGGRTE